MQMCYEVSGNGEPIVVLPGAHMNINTMGKIIPLLAESRTVYALEFQGRGRTIDIDRPITSELVASAKVRVEPRARGERRTFRHHSSRLWNFISARCFLLRRMRFLRLSARALGSSLPL
jgi:hypothetical protein